MKKLLLLLTVLMFFCFSNINLKAETEEDINEKSELALLFEEITLDTIIVAIMGALGSTTGIGVLIYFVKGMVKKANTNNLNVVNATSTINKVIDNVEDLSKEIKEYVSMFHDTYKDLMLLKNDIGEKIIGVEEETTKIINALKIIYTNNPKLVSSGVAEEIKEVLTNVKKIKSEEK